MFSELHEKKSIILLLLEELRKCNPQIGKYKKCVITEQFEYCIQLDNGSVILPCILVDIREILPSYKNEYYFEKISSQFKKEKIITAQ